ncbi:MAG: prolipoprotein diacylglyceryl transferase [Micropepsaceae bacterium]
MVWFDLCLGILLCWRYVLHLIGRKDLWNEPLHDRNSPITAANVSDLLIWAMIGVVAGERSGYIMFYGLVNQADYYLTEPWRMVAAWQGGMSFHGGMIGVSIAIVVFAGKRGINMFALGDLVAAATPIGLFFGRLANFNNGELWGKASTVPWAMLFPDPNAGMVPRHPVSFTKQDWKESFCSPF